MKKITWIVFIISLSSISCSSVAMYEFEQVDALIEQEGLPDPFLRSDGSRVRSIEQWRHQREYLKAMLVYYMYGSMPVRPKAKDVKVDRVRIESVFGEGAVKESYEVTIKRMGEEAKYRMWLIRPKGSGPWSVIVKNCKTGFDSEEDSSGTAQRDLAAARKAVSRGYLLCKFLRTDLAADTKEPQARNKGVYALYPEYSWGAITVWAWGQSVTIDVLERLGYADMDKVVVTGHSRGGQTAMAAGIFDERIDVVVPCTGGFGSCGTLRLRDPDDVRGKIDYIGEVVNRQFPHWFSKRYLEFSGRENRLTFDGHTLAALIAPRPLLNTNAIDDQFNNSLSMEAGIRIGKMIYKWMGVEKWCRIHWRKGRHAQREEDWGALLDFADEYFYGKVETSQYNQWQYPDMTAEIPWKVPSKYD